ncbi:MAG: hypothetical protein QOD53_275 [Thermoleophilaceae bacterium]|nr:hypothetical protein [Thermoleophilaceae bacterium]
MASNDPTDTGGMFIGRRPGTAPMRYRPKPVPGGPGRQNADKGAAALLLVIETVLCVSVWGPQPMGWLWVGSHVKYWTDSVSAGIVTAFVGMLITLFITLALARRVDHAWKLVRRAAGYEQERGALERIFLLALVIAGTAFLIWFFVIVGPGPTIAPRN